MVEMKTLIEAETEINEIIDDNFKFEKKKDLLIQFSRRQQQYHQKS